MKQKNAISMTALFTAQHWIQYGYPNAAYFDTITGRLIYATFALAGRLPCVPQGIRYYNAQLFLRHQTIDNYIAEFQPDILVDLGCGLTPRGITQAEQNPALTVIEADLDYIVTRKQRQLADHQLPANYTLTSMNLLEHSLKNLINDPDPEKRLLVITEGVIDYFTFPQKHRLWSKINQMMQPYKNAIYLQEVNLTLGNPTLTALIAKIVSVSTKHCLYQSVDKAREDLIACGFTSVDTIAPSGKTGICEISAIPKDAIGWHILSSACNTT